MAEEKTVPTGPKGAVRVTDDDQRTVRTSGQNPDPRFNPEDIDPATGRPRPLLVHREHVIRAGEIASVPSEEAEKLIDSGAAKAHREKKE
jgi:hypothetical protein